MKVSTKRNPSFNPIEITLVFETQEEYSAFYQVTNHSTAVNSIVNEKFGQESLDLPVNRVLTSIWNTLRLIKE